MSSSDDEAPEQVSMAVARSKALESRDSERQARKAAVAQPTKKEEIVIEDLPDDILAAVSAAQEQQNVDEEEEEEEIVKPKKSVKKNSHIRRFGNIQVTTLANVTKEADGEALPAAALSFTQRLMAPQRKRASTSKALLQPNLSSRAAK
ncbi:hypothetical protein THRCLA_05853 [Thraustotheca clavata]|uniref:Uncharacterized protein n=1 Tax=Thraustotheca clavata TaxID=74557 RepID=A0A1V9ZS30_9STRA|nr:hypothetical protein THRCLA_05853 [Thraustotheca clavata]